MSELKKIKDNKSYWCCMDCKNGDAYYFKSELSAKIFAKKKKFKDYIIFNEGRN